MTYVYRIELQYISYKKLLHRKFLQITLDKTEIVIDDKVQRFKVIRKFVK